MQELGEAILVMDIQTIIMKYRLFLNFVGVLLDGKEIKIFWRLNKTDWKVNRYDWNLYHVKCMYGEGRIYFTNNTPVEFIHGYLPLEYGDFYCPKPDIIRKLEYGFDNIPLWKAA